jgi:hypothetical protein
MSVPPDGWVVCILFTIGFMGGAAMLAGKALAANWKPAWQIAAYGVLLGAADRFLIYGLFGGELLSLTGFLFDTLLIEACGLCAWRITQASRMVAQYPWLYERVGPFCWRRFD